MKDSDCVELLVHLLPPQQGGGKDQDHPGDGHQGQKEERSMRGVKAEAEEDANSEDGGCKDEMEEEGVQEEGSLAPAMNKDEKLRAEKIKVENLKGWNIDQSYKKCLQRGA